MPDLDHNEFFNRDDPEYFADQMRERPNKKIEVKIRLNQTGVPTELRIELKNNNMDLTQSNSSSDIIIISGILPDCGFGPQQVLEIVKKYAPYAELA